MFSSEAKAKEAARDCWCCQLCVKLVTELSTQCSFYLRSWHPTAVSEQQTHFSVTPLSPNTHPPPAHFIWHSSFVPSSYFLSSLTSPLSCLLYFLTCALLSHTVWFCCHPSVLTEHTCQALLLTSHFLTQFSLSPHSLTRLRLFSLGLHVLSPPHRNFNFSQSPT